jgi:hypothetical protein
MVHGNINETTQNACKSLAEWASYQRSRMGIVDKYDPKWKMETATS